MLIVSVAVFILLHGRTLAGRPSSQRIISSHLTTPLTQISSNKSIPVMFMKEPTSCILQNKFKIKTNWKQSDFWRVSGFAARFRTAAYSDTIANGLAKIRASGDYDGASIYALALEWRPWHLAPWRPVSMCAGWRLPKPCFALRLKTWFRFSDRYTCLQHLGPICRHLMAQVIPMIRNDAHASLPGLAVGILHVLCNGLCTAKRFHVDNEEQTCRVGCIDEPDCLSHYNRCPLLSNIFVTIWRKARVHLGPFISRLYHSNFTQKPSKWDRCHENYWRFRVRPQLPP